MNYLLPQFILKTKNNTSRKITELDSQSQQEDDVKDGYEIKTAETIR